MAPPRGQRKNESDSFPIKKADGEAFTRQELMFDFLAFVFSNSEYKFTPPTYTTENAALFPTDRQWSFAELYLDCLASSSKAGKTLREKMSESQEYAVNFAKICLLVNLNRLNTTHAFWVECRTANRTFNSLPCFQIHEYTRKNLQDAPRLKAHLKGCALPTEQTKSIPDDLRQLAVLAENGLRPTTSVVKNASLIFTLVNESALVTSKYLPKGLTFADIILRPEVASYYRANIFLWLVHRFLEDPAVATDFKSSPNISTLEYQLCDPALENVDTEEEIAYGQTAKAARQDVVAKLQQEKAMAGSMSQAAEGTPKTRGALAPKDSPESTPAPSAKEGTPMPTVSLNGFASSSTQEEWAKVQLVPQDKEDQRHLATEHYWDTWLPKSGHSSTLASESRKFRAIQEVVIHQDLAAAYQRMAGEIESGLDEAYDSDTEVLPQSYARMTPDELRKRVNVFRFGASRVEESTQLVYHGRTEGRFGATVQPVF